VRIARGAHSLEPSIEYFYSNVRRRLDLNVFFDRANHGSPAGLLAHRRVRRARDRLAARRTARDRRGFIDRRGAEAGVDHVFSARWRARLDALWDDGYGGRRSAQRRDRVAPDVDPVAARRLITLAVAAATMAHRLERAAALQ